MALVIFGGVISATILYAILTPTLFLKFGRRPVERLALPTNGQSRKPVEAY